MTYQTNDSDGAQSLHFNQLLDRYQFATVSGCGVSINSGLLGQADTLTLAAGEVIFGGSTVSVASQSVQIDAANAADPRKDVVYTDSTGTAQVANGTPEAAEPSTATRFQTYRPAPLDLSGTDAVIVAEVWVPAGASSITVSDLRDRRVLADAAFGSITTEQATIGDTWNDVIVAYPGKKTIQQAFNEATAKSIVIIAGEHHENGIQMVDTKMDVYWFGEVHNDATDGTATFIHASTLGKLDQKWINPTIIGNPDSGEGIICQGDVGVGDAKANSPNKLSLINPEIRDHGGYGLWWAASVGCYIGGVLGGSNIRNNGDSEGLGRCNIRIERGAVNCILGPLFVEQTVSSVNTDRNVWWSEPNGCQIWGYDGFAQDYDLYLEGARNLSLGPFLWFENSTAADIYWGATANAGVGLMDSNKSRQIGPASFNAGIEFGSTTGVGKGIIWEADRVIPHTPVNRASELFVDYLEERSSDPVGGLYDESYQYVRSDLAPSELRVITNSGTVTTVSQL